MSCPACPPPLPLSFQVNFVAAIDVYEDGEAGLLLCYNCKLLKLTALFLGNLKEARPRFTWCLLPVTLITLQGASKNGIPSGISQPSW